MIYRTYNLNSGNVVNASYPEVEWSQNNPDSKHENLVRTGLSLVTEGLFHGVPGRPFFIKLVNWLMQLMTLPEQMVVVQ